MKNIWLDGIMGVVVGDALGVPAEFASREELKESPVTGMEGFGTYNLPAGSWSDDSSMTLATLDILQNGYDLTDLMDKFVAWYEKGEYTPYGEVFDIGNTCARAIEQYLMGTELTECGGYGEKDNGNGSLMRIMPICLYMYQKQKKGRTTDDEVIQAIHEVSGLTHGHLRSKIACGLYYFLVKSILDNEGTLNERLQQGMNAGFRHYEQKRENLPELLHYGRLSDTESLKNLPEEEIKATGYVVASFEAALWCLVRTDSYREATLMAVNLGDDTDTVAAIAGGLAGLFYGYEGIPEEWVEVIAKREWVERMCEELYNEAYRPIADEGDTHNAGNEEMDAWAKNFCKRMGVNSVEEYMPIYMKAIHAGQYPRKSGRKTLERLLKYLKINGYFSEPESQPFDGDEV